MSQSGAAIQSEALPSPLPSSPLPLLRDWLEDARARRDQPNPDAMALATVSPAGAPSVRQALCKSLDAERGVLVFYTNRRSPKMRDLEVNPRCAACFYWDHQQRQARVQGVAAATTAAEDDAYFASRPLLSRIGAWASDQSQPIESRDALLTRFREAATRFRVPPAALEPDAVEADYRHVTVPRPPHWGGVRIWMDRVELWAGMPGRMHDRALWSRTIALDGEMVSTGDWSATRLQP